MKFIRLGPDEVFHRYLTPKWAYVPLSGAGAAAEGGRFNRPGVEALYLSRQPETALAEYRQNASIVPPATLAAYIVAVGSVVDLSSGYDPAIWSSDWAFWDCSWKTIARLDRKVPPSWRLADMVIAAGHGGLLFPSTRHVGGVNLAIYPQNLGPVDIIRVHDPDRRLPHDQSSWCRDDRVPPASR